MKGWKGDISSQIDSSIVDRDLLKGVQKEISYTGRERYSNHYYYHCPCFYPTISYIAPETLSSPVANFKYSLDTKYLSHLQRGEVQDHQPTQHHIIQVLWVCRLPLHPLHWVIWALVKVMVISCMAMLLRRVRSEVFSTCLLSRVGIGQRSKGKPMGRASG